MSEQLITREVRHAHFFCGLGAAAKGMNKGRARVGNSVTRFRCIGGIDVDPAAWRERIGNAVPSDAAAAIASVMGKTLLLAWAGESFMLSMEPIWVQPLAIAMAVDTTGAVT